MIQIFNGVPFYNTCLTSFNISYHFFGGITISSTFLEFSAGKVFGFTILSAILLPIKLPVASAALRTTIL